MILETYQWIITNGPAIIEIAAYLIAAASIGVKLTPTQKDDEVLGKVKNFLSKYIALN